MSFCCLLMLLEEQDNDLINVEEGASLSKIYQMLIALERTLISGAKEHFKKKIKERRTNELTKFHFERFALDRFKEKSRPN
jgi:hypothetical protein